MYAEAGSESVTLTSIRNDQGWDVDAHAAVLHEKGFRMDQGYGALKGEVFRIAHMGAVAPDALAEYLQAIDGALDKMGVEV